MKKKLFFLIALVLCSRVSFAQLPADCSQAVIGIADGWDSSVVSLSVVEKQANGHWMRILGPVQGRLGRAGLVWGLGLHTNPRGAITKREGDGRSPAGIFRIGGLWTTHKTPVKHNRRIPEVRVDPRDLWDSHSYTLLRKKDILQHHRYRMFQLAVQHIRAYRHTDKSPLRHYNSPSCTHDIPLHQSCDNAD